MQMKKENIFLALTVLTALTASLSGYAGGVGTNLLLSNKSIAFKVSQRSGSEITLSYRLNGKLFPVATLQPTIKGTDGRLSYSITNSSANRGTITVKSNSSQGSFKFIFGQPQNYLQLAAFKNISHLQIKLTSQALVIPDQRSEDIVIYPDNWSKQQLLIPGDNMLIMNMVDNGQAILSCLWNSPNLQLTATKDKSSFSGLQFVPKFNDAIWLGINAAKNIWLKSDKIGTLNWTPPFAATWLVTIQHRNHFAPKLYESWKLANLDVAGKPKSNMRGVYIQNNEGRTWSSGRGKFIYPFITQKGRIKLIFPKYNGDKNGFIYDHKFQRLIYPIQASPKKSSSQILPYDALKQLLNRSDFEQLFNKKAPHSNYPATCGITDKVEKIFYRDAEAKSVATIKKHFRRMNLFVIYNRKRVIKYLNWGKRLQKQLADYGKRYPDAAKLTQKLQNSLEELNRQYADVKEKIKTPEYCKMLTEKIITLAKSKADAETKEDENKQLCRQIRVIGGNQDHLSSELKAVVTALRISCTLQLLTAQTAVKRKIVEKVCKATAQILHSRFPMEGK